MTGTIDLNYDGTILKLAPLSEGPSNQKKESNRRCNKYFIILIIIRYAVALVKEYP